MIDKLNTEAKNLIATAQQISYYSRGGWTYDTVMGWSALERDMAVEFINERLLAASKMPFPVF